MAKTLPVADLINNDVISGGNTIQKSVQLPPVDIPLYSSVHVAHISPPAIVDTVLHEYGDMIKGIWPNINPKIRPLFDDFANSYEKVKSFATPNFLGAQIQVNSALNLPAWHDNLLGYHDAEMFYYLRFGWPLVYNMHAPPVSVNKNHQSALFYGSHIETFIQTELEFDAITGPFNDNPFIPWTRVSPMMTRSKKDSELRRVIVDLSFPNG